jgi:hypothetical protein
MRADRDYQDVSRLLVENTDLTRAIHALTQEIHQHVLGNAATTTG